MTDERNLYSYIAMTLYPNHMLDEIDTAANEYLNPFQYAANTLAHEMGHYSGLVDEYVKPVSLMDNSFSNSLENKIEPRPEE